MGLYCKGRTFTDSRGDMMACPFLKVVHTAMNREVVTMYSCKMGVESTHLPKHCAECSMDPSKGESQ